MKMVSLAKYACAGMYVLSTGFGQIWGGLHVLAEVFWLHSRMYVKGNWNSFKMSMTKKMP